MLSDVSGKMSMSVRESTRLDNHIFFLSVLPIPSTRTYQGRQYVPYSKMRKTRFLFLWFFFILLCFPSIPAEKTTDSESIATLTDLIAENDLIITAQPDNQTAWEFRSLIMYNGGRYTEAIAAAEKLFS